MNLRTGESCSFETHLFSLPCPPFFLLPQDGRTPLDLAKKEKNREVAALLEVRLPIDRSFAFLHIDIPGINTQSTEDTVDRAQYFAAVEAGNASQVREVLATHADWANANKVRWWPPD